jgi:probable biosynthetic protein (TIGR04099 family)
LAIGEVELVSTFIRRTREADNQSIARVALPGLPLSVPAEHALTATASALRSGKVETHFGLPANGEKRLRGFRFKPDLLQEFNGAGLFYFAQFQAIVDRAFEHWFPGDATFLDITERQVFFSGNTRPGEALLIELMALDKSERAALCRIRREDGKVIGRVFVRAARPAAL